MLRRRKTKRKKSGWMMPIILVRNCIFLAIITSVLLTLLLRWVNLPYTSFMLVKQVSTSQISHKLQWTDIEKISPHLLIAVVAAEDQKFPDHFGFDFAAIQSALEKNRKSNTLRGASTITQQVAKNVFLWPKKNLFRKGLEAYFALLIETICPKWRILEIYLNVAEFSPGIFGASNAAHVHFGKNAAHLTTHEAALLAAVLPNPYTLNASRPSNYVANRAQDIAKQVRSLGGSHYLNKIWD